MKLRASNHKTAALTRIEVVVVIAVLSLLIICCLPFLLARYSSRPEPSYGLTCVNNLKEISLGYYLWAGDNNGKYPMEVSVTNGGTMEFAATGDVVKTLQMMSNELSRPKILYCPLDLQRTNAVNFVSFNQKNISYFIGLDASLNRPQTVLAGDANLAINGVLVKSGLLQFSTNAPVTWTSSRHVPDNIHFWTPDSKKHAGYIAFAGGSTGLNGLIWQTEDKTLFQAFTISGLATNRLAIP
jgi:hypothetical protein